MRLQGSSDRGRLFALLIILLVVVLAVAAYLLILNPST